MLRLMLRRVNVAAYCSCVATGRQVTLKLSIFTLFAACSGSASHSGVALLTDEGQPSLCVVVSWEDDQLLWLKSRASVVRDIGSRGFAALYDSDSELKSRGGGPAALAAMREHAGAAVSDAGSEASEVGMRVVVDGSAVEVFLSTGQVASTRVYAAQPGARRLAAVSSGGKSSLTGTAWQMETMWL